MIFRARWATGVHVAVCTAAREQLREARREHVFNFDARDFPFAEVRMFRALKDTLTGLSEQTMMKLIVDRASDRVVGCHMVGPDAGEITQGLGIALKCGATKAQFDATVGIHPTAAEEFVTMREPVPEPEAAAAAE